MVEAYFILFIINNPVWMILLVMFFDLVSRYVLEAYTTFCPSDTFLGKLYFYGEKNLAPSSTNSVEIASKTFFLFTLFSVDPFELYAFK